MTNQSKKPNTPKNVIVTSLKLGYCSKKIGTVIVTMTKQKKKCKFYLIFQLILNVPKNKHIFPTLLKQRYMIIEYDNLYKVICVNLK